MTDYLHIEVTFLDPRFHGRGDGGEPEWPPSPLRLLQAIMAANADRIGTDSDLDRALLWLESQNAPLIIAPPGEEAEPYCLSVPNTRWTSSVRHGHGEITLAVAMPARQPTGR